MPALGITWRLDGLELTLAGAVAGALKASPTLHLTEARVGTSASSYLAGAVLGAGLMIAAAGADLWLGVAAERRPLEAVARPLSHVEE